MPTPPAGDPAGPDHPASPAPTAGQDHPAPPDAHRPPDERVRPGGPELRGSPLAEFGLVRLLPAVPRSAELARAATRVACRSWGVPEVCDTAALLTTELVGNSVRHARTRNLVLRLSMTPRRLRISVADGDPTLPTLHDRGLFADAGRGLWLVSQLAERWGTEAEPGGKAVWAEIPLPVAEAAPLDAVRAGWGDAL